MNVTEHKNEVTRPLRKLQCSEYYIVEDTCGIHRNIFKAYDKALALYNYRCDYVAKAMANNQALPYKNIRLYKGKV